MAEQTHVIPRLKVHRIEMASSSSPSSSSPSSPSLSSNDLQRIFEALDRNGDGRVSLGELNWLLERVGVQYSLDELESLVGNTTLDFNEFLVFNESISGQKKGEEQEEEEEEEDDDLAKAFRVFDLNGDGFITSEELQSVLSRLGMWEENGGGDCRRMIKVYDTNSDGVLDFEEFKNMMLLTTT